MQEIDIRYAFFLLPLIYILIPFFLTGNFILLGGITLLSFISGVIVFIIIANLHIGGNASAATVGTGLTLGLNNEGGYALFVVFFGGLFYLGSQLASFFTPILNLFITIINVIANFVSWISGTNFSALNTNNIVGNSFTHLNQVYNYSINIEGISVFGALDVIFGSMFILSLYFMIASRGH